MTAPLLLPHSVAEELAETLIVEEAVGAAELEHLGAAPPRELLVEQVLVDALALGAAVLLGPGHPQPALLTEEGHELPASGSE